MDFIPNTGKDQAAMLERIGVRSAEELYEVETLGRKLAIPDGMAEQELKETVKGISQKNRDMPVFRGAGSYSHFIPAVVRHMTSRSEFYTAYTPYQPEMSQGILQAIYEYQSMVCDLTGMDVSNASVYDGATACAEAMAMAVAHSRGKNKVLVSKAVSPFYRMVLRTYAEAGDIKLIEISCPAGRTPDLNIDEKTAAVIVQSPNFFGIVEDVKNISAQAHERGTLLIQAISDATSLGLFKSPGEMSADIVAAEGQAFGIPQSFGGPYLGMMACRKELTRMLPGRIVGKTVDSEGKKGLSSHSRQGNSISGGRRRYRTYARMRRYACCLLLCTSPALGRISGMSQRRAHGERTC